MTLYSKWIYPKLEPGHSQRRPLMPFSFVKIHEVAVTWDLSSDNDDDRAEYWEDVNGTLTASEVEIAVYGPDGKDAWIAAHPEPTLP